VKARTYAGGSFSRRMRFIMFSILAIAISVLTIELSAWRG
jgi:hypothetical protein